MKGLSCALFGLAVTLLSCNLAFAQRMYRCGNQYQEFPCTGGQQSKAVNSSGAGKSAAASTTADPECAARGAASQKIMWAREAGATQDKQIADLRAKGQTDAAQAKLISAVYAKRGTVPEVRAAIEGDCVAEKDTAVQAAALRAAAAKLDGKGAGAPATAQAAAATTEPAQVNAASTVTSGGAADAKKAQCDSFVRQLENNRNSQRSSGSAAQMESLNNQRRSIETSQKAAGC